jgi:type I restriction enzyme S subunit
MNPPEELLKNYDTLVKYYFDKIYSNSLQIRTLSALRDSLLPKLMSGEVRVKL